MKDERSDLERELVAFAGPVDDVRPGSPEALALEAAERLGECRRMLEEASYNLHGIWAVYAIPVARESRDSIDAALARLKGES